ncbi:hypothetical protein HY346_02820 [Candidatus Microgenomates bacterium]|nr:hypothetical protein [Candidatus Microgenomates bacterium]
MDLMAVRQNDAEEAEKLEPIEALRLAYERYYLTDDPLPDEVVLAVAVENTGRVEEVGYDDLVAHFNPACYRADRLAEAAGLASTALCLMGVARADNRLVFMFGPK